MENCYCWYLDCTDSEAIYYISYCIQTILKEINLLEIWDVVRKSLDKQIIHEFEPFIEATFIAISNGSTELFRRDKNASKYFYNYFYKKWKFWKQG